MILHNAIKDFKFHCKFEKNLSIKTLQAYEIDLSQFECFKLNQQTNIESFDKHLLKEYIQWLYTMNLKAKTIKRKLAVIKAFFNYLEFDEMIIINPFRKIRLSIKEPANLPKTIDIREMKKLLRFLYKKKAILSD